MLSTRLRCSPSPSCAKPATVVERLAGTVDRAERRAVEIRVGRTHVEDARLQQRLIGRDRNLLIDEMGNAGLARTRNERLAQRLERRRLRGGQCPKRHALRPRRPRRKQHFDAAYREGEYAASRAFHEGASFYLIHAVLPIGAPKRFAGRCVRLVLNYSKVIVTLLFTPVNAVRSVLPRDQLAMLFQFVTSCSAPRSDSALRVKVGLAELSVGKIPHPAT